MGIIEITGSALVINIVTNLLKGAVAKWGSLTVQVSVFILAILAAFIWTYFGDKFDWKTVLGIFTLAISLYEVFWKRFWTAK